MVYDSGNSYIVDVGGTLTENTTWCPDNVYVVVSDVTIPFGLTLTIEAGTVVKFSSSTNDLVIQGILDAQGMAGTPVVFTSFHDDSHRGGSNGNGPGSSPSRGNWGGLRFFNGNNVLEYCLLRYGGPNVGAMISVEGCSPRIANNTVEYSFGRGIYYRPDQTVATAPEILCNTILEGSAEGIYYTDSAGLAQATIANNNLTGTGDSEGIDIISASPSTNHYSRLTYIISEVR